MSERAGDKGREENPVTVSDVYAHDTYTTHINIYKRI